VAGRPLEDAHDRFVDAEHIAAYPASGNSIRREVGACRLHASVRFGDKSLRDIGANARIGVANY
jgi:hypothetical protein